MGCAPKNDQTICCEVGDWFEGGFNYGSTVSAARFIVSRGTSPSRWSDFVLFAESNGGFLSESLQRDVHELWNCGGNWAYSHSWSAGIEPVGRDEDGIIWNYREDNDHRVKTVEGALV